MALKDDISSNKNSIMQLWLLLIKTYQVTEWIIAQYLSYADARQLLSRIQLWDFYIIQHTPNNPQRIVRFIHSIMYIIKLNSLRFIRNIYIHIHICAHAN